MPRIPCRKFTLADIMILVGFTAAGLAGGRYTFESLNMTPWRSYVLGYGTPLGIAFSYALLFLRLRRPRPPFRRVLRQPGASACLVGFICFPLWCILAGCRAAFHPSDHSLDIFAFLSLSTGPAVLALWVFLGLTRTGRTERGWIDRSGRWVGLGWILLMLVVFIEVAG